MEGYLDYKKDFKGYIYAKLYDSLIEGKLSLEMLQRGMIFSTYYRINRNIKRLKETGN